MKSVALLSLVAVVLGAPTIGNTLPFGSPAIGVLRAPTIGNTVVPTPPFGTSILRTPAVDPSASCLVDVKGSGPKNMMQLAIGKHESLFSYTMVGQAKLKSTPTITGPVPVNFVYSATSYCGECEIQAFGYTFTVTGGQSITKNLGSLDIPDRGARQRVIRVKCHRKVGEEAHPIQ